MRLTREHVQFNKAMDAILRADPAKVKAPERAGCSCSPAETGQVLVRAPGNKKPRIFPVGRDYVRRSELCDEYEEVTKKQWTQALGFRHALFEVAADVFKRAQNPESATSVIEAVRTTKLNTIVGPIQWQGPPLNQWT